MGAAAFSPGPQEVGRGAPGCPTSPLLHGAGRGMSLGRESSLQPPTQGFLGSRGCPAKPGGASCPSATACSLHPFSGP